MSVNERIDGLKDIVNRCQLILDCLEGNDGWLKVIDDFTAERQRLDDNWQFVNEDKQWIEWRATKMAVMKVLNILEDYKADKKLALEEIFKLENPDKIIHKDVDNS